ncbi:MAG TPA: T9SS type A sorting domain-containing protein [bacterium]|nr:T9SS type A sorting domain-containing protein [bacterium]
MRRLPAVTVLFASLSLPAAAAAQDWTPFALGTGAVIRAIQHTSFSTRYIVGDGGTVFVSNSTRTAWTPVDVGTSANLLGVHEPSQGQVWIGGAVGTVRLKSGSTWNDRDVPNTSESVVLFTGGSTTSYAAGSNGTIFRTSNSGVSWTEQASGTTAHLRDGDGGTTAYCVGDGGTILKTTNTGATWAALSSGTTLNLFAYRGVAAGAILAAGEAGTMLRSTDAGVTWTPISLPTSVTIRDMDTSGQNANWVLASGDGGVVLRSTNAGVTWCHLNTGVSATLHAVEMVTNSEYIAAGAGGLLIRSTTSGGGCYDPTPAPFVPAAPPARLQLSSAWPQPVRTAGVLRLSVDRDQRVEAFLVNVSGRRLATLYRGTVRATQPSLLNVRAEDLPAGVYFVQVNGETASATERVVVVR